MNQFAEMAGGHGTAAKGDACAVPAIGDYVQFGHYPQTADGDSLPIEWIVLETDGEAALLISRYALDVQPYHAVQESTTWDRCTLREWLNHAFYDRAFNSEEKKSILMGDVSAAQNPAYTTAPGSTTKDSVFLLSIAEAERHFAGSKARSAVATDYAVRQGAYASQNGRAACWWWLRSPGCTSMLAAFVIRDGDISLGGDSVNSKLNAVRPCVRVQLANNAQAPQRSCKEETYSPRQFSGLDRHMLAVGKYTMFGCYPQTASGDDRTPIQWIVLEKDAESALLISRYALDVRPYHDRRESTAWEQCKLREWLSHTFYDRAFTSEERNSILTSDVRADRNPDQYKIDPGRNTGDPVFLLSVPEANKYFANDRARICAGTDYVVQHDAVTSSIYRVDGRASCCWWLRSPGNSSLYAAGIDDGGSIDASGSFVDSGFIAVRPCVRVQLA